MPAPLPVTAEDQLRRDLAEARAAIAALLAELEERTTTLRAAAEGRGRALSQLSHDLQTPVTSIHSLARMLSEEEDGPLNPEQGRQIGYILESAAELAGLIDQVRALSHDVSLRPPLRAESFTLDRLCAIVRGMVAPQTVADPAVSVTFQLAGGDRTAETDLGKLAHILRHLILNALRFSGRGEVRVEAAAGDGWLALSVADDGVGLSEADQKQIFERVGWRFGLPHCRRTVERLGGTLEVSSAPDRGAVFKLALPAVLPQLTALRELAARPADPGRTPLVMILDDAELQLECEEALAQEGLQLVPAMKLQAAAPLIARFPTAAVLLSVDDGDGDEAWAFLRQLKAAEPRRVVHLCAHGDKAEVAKGFGADGFLRQPFSAEALLRHFKPA